MHGPFLRAFARCCDKAARLALTKRLLVALPILAASLTAGHAATCAVPPAAQPGLDARQQELVAYGCSEAYPRDLADEVTAAQAFVVARAGEVARPALVLDIDETALSNWPAMLANDFRYIARGPCRIDQGGPCSARAWELGARAKPIAPTLALFKAAKARGVAVFFVSGRRDEADLRAATALNLRRAGYHGWTALVMRAPDERGLTATEFKARRRALIAAQGYTIIASVGDQWSDLDGGFAERVFKLPNPFYFIP